MHIVKVHVHCLHASIRHVHEVGLLVLQILGINGEIHNSVRNTCLNSSPEMIESFQNARWDQNVVTDLL